MTNLLDLPVELLTQIVSDVEEDWYPLPSDFKPLRQTCRKLRTLADAWFFRSFKTDKDDRHPAPRFLQFSSAVARRPELRKNVKTLDLLLERNYDYDGCTEVWVPNGFDLSAFEDAASSFFEGNGVAKMWRRGTTIAVYPHVMALLSLLPDLEVLRLNVKDDKGNKNLQRLVDLLHGASHLKELKLAAFKPFDDTFPSFTPFEPILQLSSLKRLTLKHLHMADTTEFSFADPSEVIDERLTKYVPGSLTIENLSIRNCRISSDYTIQLIKACRRLTSFDYKEWANINEQDRKRKPRLDVKSWHDALSLHKDTLEELSLNNMNAFTILNEIGGRPLDAWPSFTSFLALTILKIEYRRMVYTHLPPNISHLYLFDCREISNSSEITGWIGVKSYCPHIELFEIMTTQDCRSIQYDCKYLGFKWGCWTEQTREYNKAGFELKVWFKDFIDGTYHFSQGTDDTSSVDSDGNKKPHSHEEDEGEDEDEEMEDENEQEGQEEEKEDKEWETEEEWTSEDDEDSKEQESNSGNVDENAKSDGKGDVDMEERPHRNVVSGETIVYE